MSASFINFNGQILPSDSKLLTIQNRAFRYGDGLFESMRMLKGQLKFADMHADRHRSSRPQHWRTVDH